MIEREKNRENGIRLMVMKREYTNKVKRIKEIIDENEELIEKVAQREISLDEKNEEIRILNEKKTEYKSRLAMV
jgi:predicted nuclease with TOPRIM domain